MIAPWALNKSRLTSLSHSRFFALIHTCVPDITPLVSRGDRPLTLTFEHQLEMLVFYHLHGYKSGAELLQAMEEDDFAREHIAPPGSPCQASSWKFVDAVGPLAGFYDGIWWGVKKIRAGFGVDIGRCLEGREWILCRRSRDRRTFAVD
jgi:hypothetical protein